MESLDLRVLADALAWRRAGHTVQLVTVVETWGSAPRPPGALLAVRDDGVVSGSVSGGCVEDDLIARTKAAMQSSTAVLAGQPAIVTYGVSKEEATRFGLPCGGTLRLLQESLADTAWVVELLDRTAAHHLVSRSLHIPTGVVTLQAATRDQQMEFDGETLTTLFGPRWRLLLVGAGQLSQAVAAMAQALDFEVLVCDPREEYAQPWLGSDGVGAKRVSGMPDDAVTALYPDPHTAIVALTHDPKLDDMALMEALRSKAFYVGALGSRRNQAARKSRLKEHFGLTDAELDKLHGPVGLNIYAKTPAEIAVSIVAQLVLVKNAPHPYAKATAPSASGCAVDG